MLVGQLGGQRLHHRLELLPPLHHRRHRPFEHHLERGELLVDVVLGLVAEPAAVGLGVGDDLLGDPPRLAGHLGALDHALGLHPPGLDDVLGVAARLREVLLALLEQPPGVAQLLGHRASARRSARAPRRG